MRNWRAVADAAATGRAVHGLEQHGLERAALCGEMHQPPLESALLVIVERVKWAAIKVPPRAEQQPRGARVAPGHEPSVRPVRVRPVPRKEGGREDGVGGGAARFGDQTRQRNGLGARLHECVAVEEEDQAIASR
eukprot:5771324-Prymnesium_polylepis.1